MQNRGGPGPDELRNMFIAIGWLYYSFSAFLLGTELIATLRKKDVLLLKELFSGTTQRAGYMEKLASHFGQHLERGEFVFREGDTGNEMYYIVSGTVAVLHGGTVIRQLNPGEYFGEMAVLTNATRAMDAVITSDQAQILRICSENIETLLIEEPKIALAFLREMALRLRQSSGTSELSQ